MREVLNLKSVVVRTKAASPCGSIVGSVAGKVVKGLVCTILSFFLLMPASAVFATPSTQIWIPSTDIQDYGVVHLGADVYNTLGKTEAEGGSTIVNYGLTTGVVKSDKFGIEAGIDWRETSGDPVYFNAKIGFQEGALFEGAPAFAFGGYDFGTDSSTTDYNILYGLVAKTFGNAGRFSIGYYSGNDDLLVDENGNADEKGILASWDRSFGEKFWAAVDYDMYNQSGVKDTMTFQVDIDF